MKLRYLLYLLVIGLLYSCEPELDEYSYSPGSANFSTYVSLGNSLTAGYADGSLYRSGQLNSYPSILAEQFQKVGGGKFEQPLMDGEYGILPGKLELGFSTDCLGVTDLAPVPADGQTEPITNIGMQVHNLGVPGAKSFHLLAEGYGNLAGVPAGLANPYYARFASSNTSSVLQDALALNPTFFTLWIGNNDVLGYATTGGIGDTITGQATFAFALQTILDGLTGVAQAKGAIANIPDITNIPFFTTVPANGLVLTQEQADMLNGAGIPGVQFNAGPNYFLVSDPSNQIGFRQMVEGELLLLTVPQDQLKCEYLGGVNPQTGPNPIPQQYYLSIAQIDAIKDAVAGYNAVISQMAGTFNLALVDINSIMKQLQDGIITNGDKFNTEFVTGNAFSLDGIHLTQKGYAFVANKFIEAINMKYGATVPLVSTTEYEAVALP